jgi:hypothetical protein
MDLENNEGGRWMHSGRVGVVLAVLNLWILVPENWLIIKYIMKLVSCLSRITGKCKVVKTPIFFFFSGFTAPLV